MQFTDLGLSPDFLRAVANGRDEEVLLNNE